ncbi:MAG: hypothetical protein AXA67_07515 [Methylothermaceae bacteria B42]|nr:MAG: hypothetical protein AXA67_07515 [Methylothermaceae bacteria B42]HHJ40126.1 septum site-determining protein MinC [Methylothermaceae bacterium]
MTADSAEQKRSPVVEIKGGSVTLPIVKLLGTDITAIVTQLKQRVKQSPDFFRSAPVMIDATALEEDALIDLAALVEHLRGFEMVPMGIRGGGPDLREVATSLKLALLSQSSAPEVQPQKPPSPRPEKKAPKPVASVPATSLLIDQPVRSGQRVYARNCDLIVTAPVSYGAEIIADGHIHVYDTLRGRALAGVQGDTHCRIFCHDLQAELISIAGHYRISEDLDEKVQGRPVQIRLQDTTLIIDEI